VTRQNPELLKNWGAARGRVCVNETSPALCIAGDPKKLVIVEGRMHSVTDRMIKLTIDWFNSVFTHKQ
jgi:hypothetical protein